MREIANINGKRIYSDKQMTGIQNSRITFADGSWCDVSTGEIVNRGPGGISIGNSGGDTEKITAGPERFVARNLSLLNFQADVEVGVHDERVIIVTIEGPKSDVDAIKSFQDHDTVVIEGRDGDQSSSGMTVISGGGIFLGGGNIRASNIVVGNINIGGGSASNLTKVSVMVPKETGIRVQGVEGNVTIGDTEGALRCTAPGVTNFNIGRVGSTNLRISGSGRAEIKAVTGELKTSISGSGRLKVLGGSIDQLEVNISGSGRVSVETRVQEADLDVSGSGRIWVLHSVNKPSVSRSGSGRIEVTNWS